MPFIRNYFFFLVLLPICAFSSFSCSGNKIIFHHEESAQRYELLQRMRAEYRAQTVLLGTVITVIEGSTPEDENKGLEDNSSPIEYFPKFIKKVSFHNPNRSPVILELKADDMMLTADDSLSFRGIYIPAQSTINMRLPVKSDIQARFKVIPLSENWIEFSFYPGDKKLYRLKEE